MTETFDIPWLDVDVVIGDWLYHIINEKLLRDERKKFCQVVNDAAASSGGDVIRFGGDNDASEEVSSWLLYHTDWGRDLNSRLPESVAESVVLVLADNPSLVPKASRSLAENVAQEVELSGDEVFELLQGVEGLIM